MAQQTYTEEPLYHSGEREAEVAEVHDADEEAAGAQIAASAPRSGWHTEDGMGKRIVGILVAVAVVYLLYLGYERYKANGADNGTVRSDDTGESVVSTPSRSDTPTVAKPQAAVVQSTMPVTATSVSAPATDSISPNPPNGMAFAGTGKFQVYRQGNLTWRVDTESGNTCILFATMEEWRRPIVYQHACSNS